MDWKPAILKLHGQVKKLYKMQESGNYRLKVTAPIIYGNMARFDVTFRKDEKCTTELPEMTPRFAKYIALAMTMVGSEVIKKAYNMSRLDAIVELSEKKESLGADVINELMEDM